MILGALFVLLRQGLVLLACVVGIGIIASFFGLSAERRELILFQALFELSWSDLRQRLRSRRHLLMVLQHLLLPSIKVVLVMLQIQIVTYHLRELLLFLIELLLSYHFRTASNCFLVVIQRLDDVPIQLLLIRLGYCLRFLHHLVLHFLNQLFVVLVLAFVSVLFLLRELLSLLAFFFHLPYLVLAEPFLNPDVFAELENVGDEDPPSIPLLRFDSWLAGVFVHFESLSNAVVQLSLALNFRIVLQIDIDRIIIRLLVFDVFHPCFSKMGKTIQFPIIGLYLN